MPGIHAALEQGECWTGIASVGSFYRQESGGSNIPLCQRGAFIFGPCDVPVDVCRIVCVVGTFELSGEKTIDGFALEATGNGLFGWQYFSLCVWLGWGFGSLGWVCSEIC